MTITCSGDPDTLEQIIKQLKGGFAFGCQQG